MIQRPVFRFITVAALTAIYILAGKFGLSLAFVHASASAVWPPTGIALAAVLTLGYWVWPGIWIGAFIVNLTTAGTIATSIGIATGNALEALTGAFLLNRFALNRETFDQTKNILKYVILAGFLSTTVSATFGVTSLSLGGFAQWDQYGSIWFSWWLGDMVSALIITPLLVIWSTRPLPRLGFKKSFEAVLLVVLAFCINRLVFEGWVLRQSNYALSFLNLPLLFWAAFRFGQHGATLIALLMSGVALWATFHGFGSFDAKDPNTSLLLLQGFMGTVTLTGLVSGTLLSELKEKEKILQERQDEEKFRAVTETALDAIISADQSGKIIYFNKAAEHIFGYAGSDVMGKPLTVLMPKRYHEAHLNGLNHYIKTRESRVIGKTVELTGRRRNGVEFPLELSLASWKTGMELFFTAIIRDITERKKAEEALQRKNFLILLLQVIAAASNRAQTVEEAIQICLDEICSHTDWLIGHAYKLTPDAAEQLVSTGLWYSGMSPRFQKFRYATEGMRVAPDTGLPKSVWATKKPVWIKDARVNPQFERNELAHELGLGAAFAFPILVADEVEGVLEFFSDKILEPDEGLLAVTPQIGAQLGLVMERQLAEEALQQAYKELEIRVEERTHELKQANERLKKLDEIKSYFILAASHELKTPLTSIQGYIKLILGNQVGPLNDTQRNFLTRVEKATERFHRLLNQLLSLSKIEAGQMAMEIRETNLEDLLRDEVIIFKPQAEQKEIRLDLEIKNELRFLRCDPDKIREVVDNLISNALKYTPREGRVRVIAKRLPDNIQIQVKDTGIGIKPEDQAKVFNAFYRLHPSGLEGEESTGLGLALVKKMVEAHQGVVSVESQEGKGSTFTVLLPAPFYKS